ncbi:GTPase HflX [Desulfobacterota bacterium AH_259_B03_O07]|nr:GTPase HflX [Desulfobacterota bacterium AH_259_B03_O07]
MLVNRKGRVETIFIGDSHHLPFDKLQRPREAKYRLRGYRLLHTHLKNHNLSHPDLVTLLNERLDLIGVLEVRENGSPGRFQIAHILPPNHRDQMWKIINYNDLGRVDINFEELVSDIEEEIEKSYFDIGGMKEKEGAFLIGVFTKYRKDAEESLKELESLARSADRVVLDKTLQSRKHIDPRYLIGKGKLEEVILRARQVGAESLIFDLELSPAQVTSISEKTNLIVIDRTQLILEIFAKHAVTSEGKIQVQLAQLRYMLPRLTGRGVELSQLAGGIGTRGPGEKKLEEERRRLRKQIEHLEKQTNQLVKRREHTRKKRTETGIPTVTLIGYTNVGKSTLFNALTKSNVVVENKLFSTLNPTTRRIVLPSNREILITDTVGFIRNLPNELIKAFRATLEEMGESSLLIQVADSTDPLVDKRIESVETILGITGSDTIPRIIVFNKIDSASTETIDRLKSAYRAPLISAFKKETFNSLLELLEEKLYRPRTYNKKKRSYG